MPEEIYFRPVNRIGEVQPGFDVKPGVLEARYKEPSEEYGEPGEWEPATDCFGSKVSKESGILQCGLGESGYAACYADLNKISTVYCARDPEETTLTEISEVDIHLSRGSETRPWMLELADGTKCAVRIGGSWGTADDGREAHYGCEGVRAVMTLPDSPTNTGLYVEDNVMYALVGDLGV
ncbi:MAG: hypothetical protein Q4A82_06200 [Corynebacterium sp.]|nr:hypothetical protein [Corynebacterium sp.]